MERFQYGVDYIAYNMETLELMYNARVCGIPLSFYLLDLRKTDTYCHLTSNILVHFLEGSNRVEGEIPTIPGDDKGHSWVEKDGIVYDATKGSMWKKESYYERYGPMNAVVISREETEEDIKEYFRYSENSPEMYIAVIRDIEEEIDKMIYGKVLRSHIDRLIEEKGLDTVELDQELVDKFIADLKSVYQHTKEFKEKGQKKN